MPIQCEWWAAPGRRRSRGPFLGSQELWGSFISQTHTDANTPKFLFISILFSTPITFL